MIPNNDAQDQAFTTLLQRTDRHPPHLLYQKYPRGIPAPNKCTILCDPAGNRTRDPWLKDDHANE